MGQVNTTPTDAGASRNLDSGCLLQGQSGKAPSYKDFEEPWRMSHYDSSQYYVRKIQRDNWAWHQYALNCGLYITGSIARVEPTVLFTCKIQPRKSRYTADKLDSKCRSVIKALIWHRGTRHCDCTFDYIRAGHTSCESSKICEERCKRVLKAMKKHDKVCGCGAFDLGVKPKTSASTTSKGSSTHAVDSPEELSDKDGDLFGGLPRKL